MISLKNVAIIFLLSLAIGLSTWSLIISKENSFSAKPLNSNQPDTIMESVSALIMNKDGTPKLKISTPLMLHFAENNLTEITKPQLIIYRESPNPWYVKADYAKTFQGLEEIDFRDNVTINHPADKENPLTDIRTNSLNVFPDTQIVRTDSPIIITQPDTTIRAVGMRANLKDGTIKLLSQARGEYVPR